MRNLSKQWVLRKYPSCKRKLIMNNKWIKFFAAVLIGIMPVEFACYWLGVSVGDLVFFTGAFFMIGWGTLVDIATDDPKFIEEIKKTPIQK